MSGLMTEALALVKRQHEDRIPRSQMSIPHDLGVRIASEMWSKGLWSVDSNSPVVGAMVFGARVKNKPCRSCGMDVFDVRCPYCLTENHRETLAEACYRLRLWPFEGFE